MIVINKFKDGWHIETCYYLRSGKHIQRIPAWRKNQKLAGLEGPFKTKKQAQIAVDKTISLLMEHVNLHPEGV